MGLLRIYRFIFAAEPADSLFLLALSVAGYLHTGHVWLIYPICFAVVMSFMSVLRDIATWFEYLGKARVEQAKATNFLAQCIRDKDFNIKHSGVIRDHAN